MKIHSFTSPDPVDYLVIGHITQDITPSGNKIGGTVSFSGLTAASFGKKVGIVTSCAYDLDISPVNQLEAAIRYCDRTTTFENIQTPNGRIQRLHQRADELDLSSIPEAWRNAPIVHLGPLAREVAPTLVHAFPNSMVCVTPQGWLRDWDTSGKVRVGAWPEASYVLEGAEAAVLSLEDVGGDESLIEEMMSSVRVMAVTEGAIGARVFWNGDLRWFTPPVIEEVDPTGAGDIFAAAFFILLNQMHDPWEAARTATRLASNSVTRSGLLSVPTREEIQVALLEVV